MIWIVQRGLSYRVNIKVRENPALGSRNWVSPAPGNHFIYLAT
jgi:hypothetical protein